MKKLLLLILFLAPVCNAWGEGDFNKVIFVDSAENTEYAFDYNVSDQNEVTFWVHNTSDFRSNRDNTMYLIYSKCSEDNDLVLWIIILALTITILFMGLRR